MKKLVKAILIAVPVLVIAATVGLGMSACDDEPGEPDLAVRPDQAVAHDLSRKD